MPEGAVRRLHDRGGPGQQEEAQDKLLLPRLQKHMAGYKLLIIDELGFVPLSKTGSELLFEPISQRYERRATFIASSLPFRKERNLRIGVSVGWSFQLPTSGLTPDSTDRSGIAAMESAMIHVPAKARFCGVHDGRGWLGISGLDR